MQLLKQNLKDSTAEEISELVDLSITEVKQSLKNTGRHIYGCTFN